MSSDNNKRKICFAINSFEQEIFTGGKEKFTSILIDFFRNSKRFDIDIICNKNNTKAVPEGVNKIITLESPIDCPEKYDIIFTDGIITPLKSYNAGINAVYLHDFSLKYLRQGFKLFKKIKYYVMPKHLKRIEAQEIRIKDFDIIFAVSEKVKKDVVQNLNCNPDKVKVVYPGLDNSVKRENARNYPSQDFTFGLVASNFKGKGGFVFLKTLKILQKNNSDFKAMIVIPKAKERIKIRLLLKLMRLEKTVEIWTGQKTLDNFYENIDCLCVPSLVETFGMVTLEAMAAGLPVIASDNCGCSEIVCHLDNGMIFNHLNSKNLAQMMLQLLESKDLYESISSSALNTADNFSWNKVYEDILNYLTGVKSEKV